MIIRKYIANIGNLKTLCTQVFYIMQVARPELKVYDQLAFIYKLHLSLTQMKSYIIGHTVLFG